MLRLLLRLPLSQVYALVSREKTVLAEYTASSGNFPTVTRVLLAKIPSHDGRMSYVYDKYVQYAWLLYGSYTTAACSRASCTYVYTDTSSTT